MKLSLKPSQLLCLLFVALVTSDANAQIAKLTAVMTNMQATLYGVAITIFSIALMWVGFKMAFQHAKWSEVSDIAIGGIIAGGSTAIATYIFTA
ncbi:TrbC/VirB2 family protein (plasmid) [Ampullimonas aquatilis]|uniref:TrbC/VirB2 family protein n=1 Tax=Ampullimonas aquatilis TaxID=1341549 RepID=UPI003C716E25